jgi:DNA-directed DNA polymerase III PolC
LLVETNRARYKADVKNFVTCHCHQQSLDTASTPEAFAAKELELGTGYLTVTDHGTLQAARRVFELAKNKKLTPIIGLEAYFRDDDCDILRAHGVSKAVRYRNPETGEILGEEAWVKLGDREKRRYEPEYGFWEHMKYMHITMHFMDAEAYETGVRILSAADDRAEKHGSERKPLFNWRDLEELGAKNVTMTSSCLVGVVQRHLVGHDDIEIAEAYYQRLIGICKPGNFYAEVFPHKCDKNWDSTGYLIFEDGSRERIQTWKKLKFKGSEGKVQDYARHWRPGRKEQLLAVMHNRKWQDREPRVVTGIEVVEGFIQNECRPWAEDGDVQRGANIVVLYLAEKYGTPVLIGDDSHYAHPDEKIVQDVRLQAGGGSWRFYGHYHRQSSAEALAHFQQTLGISEREFESWVENSYSWAEKFKGFSFRARKSIPASFYPADTFQHTMDLIEKHGRMRWDKPEWVERLQKEIEMLHNNGVVDLLPYFMIDEEVCDFYAKQGILTGPGRGSAAGMLLAYLLRITHVNPLQYGLSMERFLTASRIRSGKLPDIDQDLSAKHRELLTDPNNGWLRKRFGDHVAAISTDVSLKLRSSIKDVCRVFHGGRVPDEVEHMTRHLPNAPQGISDYDFVFGYNGSDGWVRGIIETDPVLKQFIEKYPREWEIIKKTLGLTRNKSKHACAYVIADEPIHNFIPLTSVGEDQVKVTQYTSTWVEAVGGLKMDFLGLNSLDDIAACIKLIQERSGWTPQDMILDGEKVLAHEIVPYKGRFYSIWKLPEDQAVFRDFCEGKTETVFQFNTPSAVGWLKHFDRVKEIRPDGEVVKALDSIEALSAFTALDRPGPLDYFVEAPDGARHNMLVEFARRSAGLPPIGEIPELTRIIPETYGIIVYQEQLQKIFYVLGKTTLEEADEFRVHISKKQAAKVIEDKKTFMRGAVESVGEEAAQNIWQSMETFAQYGFNKSHATAYSVISYACAFLKHHFPLEWWTAVLRHADKDEINTKFWRHCGHLIDLPDVKLSGPTFEIINGRIRAPLNLLRGIGETAHEQLIRYRPYRDLEDFCQKIQAHREETATVVKKEQKVKVKTLLRTEGRKKIYDEREEVRVVEQKKLGHSALNRSVITTLIVSGAMDSFFPQMDQHGEFTTVDALARFNEVMARVAGKKRPDPVDKKYLSLNRYIKYQMRKAVLPVYTEPLVPMIMQVGHPGLHLNENDNKRPEFELGGCRAPFVVFEELEHIRNHKPWPDNYVVTVAVAGYVTEARKFGYGGGKEAMELTLDMDGGQVKVVKWPGRQSQRLPEHLRDPGALKGAIVVAQLTKYSEDRPFTIEDVAIIQPPLDCGIEASPDSE